MLNSVTNIVKFWLERDIKDNRGIFKYLFNIASDEEIRRDVLGVVERIKKQDKKISDKMKEVLEILRKYGLWYHLKRVKESVCALLEIRKEYLLMEVLKNLEQISVHDR